MISKKKLKDGMTVYDCHSYHAGNTTMRTYGIWNVRIISVTEKFVLASWNGNQPQKYYGYKFSWYLQKPFLVRNAMGFYRKATKEECAAKANESTKLQNKKMKILTFGDIHGYDFWKKYDFTKYDKVIFVGDYVDDYLQNDFDIIDNLKQIIETKKKNIDKVVLLWGNHDLQYLFLDNNKFACSGFRTSYSIIINSIFQENKKLFQAAFEYNGYLWTHAGVSEQWYNYSKPYVDKFEGKEDGLANTLNNMFDSHLINMLAMVGPIRGGSDRCGGIFWADIRELVGQNQAKKFYLCGHQIVGHNCVKKIIEYDWITFVDTHIGDQVGYKMEI
jgi:hypothetical protein